VDRRTDAGDHGEPLILGRGGCASRAGYSYGMQKFLELLVLFAVVLAASPPAAVWRDAVVRQASPPPGITRTPLIENDSVMMARLRMAPGAKEDLHTHPFAAIVIQLTGGDVEMRMADARTTSSRPAGFVEFIANNVPHAAANAGRTPFDLVTIALKPERKRGGEAPAQAAPAGITRSPVLDNADAQVTRVEFAPQAREPVHSHPFDLVVVPLTGGRLEVRVGERVDAREYAPGEAMFLPRDIPHAVSNVGSAPITVFSVRIK
jgi:quercetin dioxygenase-like cupin family protein